MRRIDKFDLHIELIAALLEVHFSSSRRIKVLLITDTIIVILLCNYLAESKLLSQM